jgi:hypothetical protein
VHGWRWFQVLPAAAKAGVGLLIVAAVVGSFQFVSAVRAIPPAAQISSLQMPEFERRLSSWSQSYGFGTACAPKLLPGSGIVLVNPIIGPGEARPEILDFDPDASHFAYPLSPRFVSVQWDLSAPWLPASGQADYVALWQQAGFRTPSEQLAGRTEEQLLNARYGASVTCSYSDAQGDQGTIYALSARAAAAIPTSSGNSHPESPIEPYNSLASAIRVYLGLLSLWAIGALLILGVGRSVFTWPLAAGIALPVGCLAAVVELASFSLLHLRWELLALASPWMALLGVLSVIQRRALRAALTRGVLRRRPALTRSEYIPLIAVAGPIGLLLVLAPVFLPIRDGFSAGYFKAESFWTNGSLVPFYEHASELFYAQPAHPPFVALLLNWLYLAAGGIDEHATLVLWPALLASLLTALYALVRTNASRRVALCVVAGFTLVASDVTASALAFGFADLPLALFLLGGVGVIWLWGLQSNTGSRGALIVGGALLAGAAWTKEEGLVAGPVVLLMVGLLAWRRRPVDGKGQWIVVPLAPCLVYAALLVPLLVLHVSYPAPEVIVHAASIEQLLDRLPSVVVGLGLRLIQHWFAPIALLCVAAWQLRRTNISDRSRVATWAWLLPAAVVTAQLGADIAGLAFNSFDVDSELSWAAGRLLLHMSPLVYLAAVSVYSLALRSRQVRLDPRSFAQMQVSPPMIAVQTSRVTSGMRPGS